MAGMTVAGKTPAELLATPVQFLKGVGPQRAELLARLGLLTARDLLFYLPRDYQDLTELARVTELRDGALVRLRGRIDEVDLRNTAGGGSMLGVLLRCEDGAVRLLWFNQAYMRERFRVGEEMLVAGKVRLRGLHWELPHPQVQGLDAEGQVPSGLWPVYGLTEGLTQAPLRTILRGVLETHLGLLDEVFPSDWLTAHDLAPLGEALAQIHFPADQASLARARRRLIYQELFILQLALATKRQHEVGQLRAPALASNGRIDARIRKLFPFALTACQERAIGEVSHDMGQTHPMNRLLQGDVGSGKTVVAVHAMLLAVANGHQAVLMAPTEVLARQHTQTLERTLAASKVRWKLLTGALSAAQRTEVLEEIRSGTVDVVIGTQAVAQAGVEFARLGLVVIDEQHRFGVRQRATLKQSGESPHYLVMTATPIPRTVAMTLYGDLEVSTLREHPPGRAKLHTYLADATQRDRWWEFVRKKLREGRQGYVVAPLVDESEEVQATSLNEAYEELANGALEEFRLGLIHGRMSTSEKESAMDAFRRGETQVLVATTVVEVGVDVPNATLMTIEGGERFGLSQLHQLRGRIGRGSHPGYCCVFADASADDARRRLEAFVSITDGFQLAEIDFDIRGPGDLLGTRQHGLPPFRIADLVRDVDVLQEARRDAQAMVHADPDLGQEQHRRLRRMMHARYGQVLDLGNVG